MVCLTRGSLPQILLGPFLNTLSHVLQNMSESPKYYLLWKKFIKGLKMLERVSVQRHVLCDLGNRKVELNGFYDSSGEAYSGYVDILNGCNHKVTVKLLVSKCELVPSKSFSIPRLELLSCLCVGSEAKWRISKRLLQNKTCQIFRKTNISYHLKRTHTWVYQGARNGRFSENWACFVFL